jgi:RYK receptor-like tyrosine kinase
LVLQLLKGVNYLHSKHVVHRDVATRNCWLDTNFSLKIGDFALSRDLFPQDYHCLADNDNKPVMWMSLESLTNNVFNVRTDVWSCGVFIWECFTLSSQPYEQVDPFEFADYLAASESNRLERPSNCPQELFDVYSNCWSQNPQSRPSLKELFNATHKFYNTLNNYV